MQMSKPNPISVHPDSEAQKQQIVSQARKQDESISEYLLTAVEQRMARETEAERVDELEIDSQLDELKERITQGVSTATDVDTHQEPLYGIALWELLAGEHSEEKRQQAIQDAHDTLAGDLKGLDNKRDGGDD